MQILGYRHTIDGDVNYDCRVNLVDLTIVLANYDASGQDLEGDLDHNGHVDLADLTTVLANYDETCP